MFKQLVIVVALAAAPSALHAQASLTASRAAILQLGGGVVYAEPGSSPNHFKGVFAFADLDLTPHFGGEFEINQIYSPSGNDVTERTYELGVRYHRTFGRFEPFAKAMVGRGVFNYTHNEANLAYNLVAAGIGADVRLTRHVNLRAGYEYQHWLSFRPGTLSPSLGTVGAAFRF